MTVVQLYRARCLPDKDGFFPTTFLSTQTSAGAPVEYREEAFVREMPDIPKVITIPEIAEMCHLSKSGAYDLARKLPAKCKCRFGRLIRILEEPFREWMEAGGTARKLIPQQRRPYHRKAKS